MKAARKADVRACNNIMSSRNKSVSAETSKLIGNVNSGLEQLSTLREAFRQDPGVFKPLTTIGNPQA